jgi:SAM-dependent methyltransferase
VGCATGKATRPLLERGCDVVCVELGPQLAAEARRRLGVEVHNAAFETWDGPPGAFDLVFAATAWHWLEPELRYRRAHALLRPGGHLAFWAADHGFPIGFDPFFTELQEVYDAIGESYPDSWPPPTPEELPDERPEIEASGLFGDVAVRRYLWELRYTADEYIALLDTFSGHITMRDDQRAQLYGEIRRRLGARRVVRHWRAVLHVARALDM